MANAWSIIGGEIGVQPITTTQTTLAHPLGKKVCAEHATYGEAEFIYLLGVASTAAGDWVSYNSDTGVYTTARLVANAVGDVAVAMSANVASQYGWYMIKGNHPTAAVLTSIAANAVVWATATAGSVDDASVAGDFVTGAICREDPADGVLAAEFQLNYPFVNNATSNS